MSNAASNVDLAHINNQLNFLLAARPEKEEEDVYFSFTNAQGGGAFKTVSKPLRLWNKNSIDNTRREFLYAVEVKFAAKANVAPPPRNAPLSELVGWARANFTGDFNKDVLRLQDYTPFLFRVPLRQFRVKAVLDNLDSQFNSQFNGQVMLAQGRTAEFIRNKFKTDVIENKIKNTCNTVIGNGYQIGNTPQEKMKFDYMCFMEVFKTLFSDGKMIFRCNPLGTDEKNTEMSTYIDDAFKTKGEHTGKKISKAQYLRSFDDPVKGNDEIFTWLKTVVDYAVEKNKSFVCALFEKSRNGNLAQQFQLGFMPTEITLNDDHDQPIPRRRPNVPVKAASLAQVFDESIKYVLAGHRKENKNYGIKEPPFLGLNDSQLRGASELYSILHPEWEEQGK